MVDVHEQHDAGEPDPLVKVSEVAKLFDVQSATIRAWLKDGTLSGTKIGKGHYWRVYASSVKKLATSRYGETK